MGDSAQGALKRSRGNSHSAYFIVEPLPPGKTTFFASFEQNPSGFFFFATSVDRYFPDW
jgi:hypothetical protein